MYYSATFSTVLSEYSSKTYIFNASAVVGVVRVVSQTLWLDVYILYTLRLVVWGSSATRSLGVLYST